MNASVDVCVSGNNVMSLGRWFSRVSVGVGLLALVVSSSAASAAQWGSPSGRSAQGGTTTQRPPATRPGGTAVAAPPAVTPASTEAPASTKTSFVQLTTSMGPIVIELDETSAPMTCANFIEYVKDGFYDGTCFHRVVPSFVVQAGGFGTDLAQKPTREPIKSEWKPSVKNMRGAVAMNRLSNRPDSATSQFFINVADNAGFDSARDGAGYTVFGRVVDGMDVVDRMSKVQTATNKGMRDVPVQPVVIEKAEWSSTRPSPESQVSGSRVAQHTDSANVINDASSLERLDPIRWTRVGLVISPVETPTHFTGGGPVYRVEAPGPAAPEGVRRYLYGPEEPGVPEGPFPVSVIARAGDLRFLQLALNHRGGNFANFDLESGAVTRVGDQVAAVQSEALGEGWYRLDVTFTVGSVGRVGGLRRLVAVDSGDVGFLPMNTKATGHFFLASPKLQAEPGAEGNGAASSPGTSTDKAEPKS